MWSIIYIVCAVVAGYVGYGGEYMAKEGGFPNWLLIRIFLVLPRLCSFLVFRVFNVDGWCICDPIWYVWTLVFGSEPVEGARLFSAVLKKAGGDPAVEVALDLAERALAGHDGTHAMILHLAGCGVGSSSCRDRVTDIAVGVAEALKANDDTHFEILRAGSPLADQIHAVLSKHKKSLFVIDTAVETGIRPYDLDQCEKSRL